MIKVGLVGCGRISEKHFEVYENFKDRIKLVSVCDIVLEKAKKVSERFSVPYYKNLEDMISKESMDLLAICTPSGLHPVHGIMAAKKKINVLTEKPMAVNLKDADKLISECRKNKVKLFVVKQNRLNPTIQLLKRAIEKNRFENIYFINSTVFWNRPQEYYDQAKWRGTWKYDGGAFLNQASHYVDLMVWLGGEVKEVVSITARLARKIEAEDSGGAVLRYKNGALGVLQVTMLTYPRNYEGSITVIGEKGTVKVGGTALNRIEKWEFEKYDDDDSLVEKVNYIPKNVYGEGHFAYYDNVLNSLEEKGFPLTDGDEGRKSLELIMAIYEASKNGKKIFLKKR